MTPFSPTCGVSPFAILANKPMLNMALLLADKPIRHVISPCYQRLEPLTAKFAFATAKRDHQIAIGTANNTNQRLQLQVTTAVITFPRMKDMAICSDREKYIDSLNKRKFLR